MTEHLEEAILGATMLCGEAYPEELFDVESRYFTDLKRAAVFAAIKNLIGNREPVDEISVYHKLQERGEPPDFAYLSSLVYDIPTSTNLDIWCRQLIEEGQKRETRSMLQDAANSDDIEYIFQTAKTALQRSQSKKQQGLVPVRKVLGKLMVELEHEQKNPDGHRIAKSGIPGLDRLLTMEAGALTIVAGRPGMGKTALAGTVAKYCAKDITKGVVALFSLEMSATALIRRMLAGEMQTDTRHLANANQERLGEKIAKLQRLNLYVDDRAGLQMSQIATALGRIKDVRLVIVDYLQLINNRTSKAERQDIRVGEVTKGLKALSKDFECHVIALCQLNRGAEQNADKRPSMTNLRDSGQIEEDADNILFLYRDSYYSEDGSENAEIIVAKQRNGPTGVAYVSYNRGRQTFYEEIRRPER